MSGCDYFPIAAVGVFYSSYTTAVCQEATNRSTEIFQKCIDIIGTFRSAAIENLLLPTV